MNEYIVSQMQQDKQQWEGRTASIMMSVIIRKVYAATNDIKAFQKLNIECVELIKLQTIQ